MASIAYLPHTPIPPLAASDSLLLIPSPCLNLFRWKPPPPELEKACADDPTALARLLETITEFGISQKPSRASCFSFNSLGALPRMSQFVWPPPTRGQNRGSSIAPT